MVVTKDKERLIVGLGNPGARYQNTRHNLGAIVVRRWGERHHFLFKREERRSVDAARAQVDGVTLHLVLPTTYMNDSGRAVKSYMAYFGIEVPGLVVVVDDVTLSFGGLRLRSGGSAGGHNGLKSIEGHLGTQQYARLRLGIGAPAPRQELADYVLGHFSPAEHEQLPQLLAKGTAAVGCLVVHSMEAAMNLINAKDWQWSHLNNEQEAR